mmetsp:Transcript_22966/g.35470  ORF Transcript_22966/g.35470 Transcript_22966/m.35470 type:complete len:268 (-) Transcript_22966:283-1086(-)
MAEGTPEQWTAMSKLVQQFFSKPDAEPFREEVNWKMLGLFDYPQIIKKPMDLGTVKKKMAAKKYKTIHLCAQDVRLVWNNCMTYNADGSEFYVLAQELSKKWEDKYQKLTKDWQVSPKSTAAAVTKPPSTPSSKGGANGSGPSSSSSLPQSQKSQQQQSSQQLQSQQQQQQQSQQQVVSLEEKKTFARNLYKISKEELGKILVELDAKSPSALVKNHAEDEVEINVDNIKPDVFYEIVKYVESCMTSSGGTSSKKKKTKSSSKKQKT